MLLLLKDTSVRVALRHRPGRAWASTEYLRYMRNKRYMGNKERSSAPTGRDMGRLKSRRMLLEQGWEQHEVYNYMKSR